jgi:hypothetical protein
MKKVQLAFILLIIIYGIAYLVSYERTRHRVDQFNNECIVSSLKNPNGPATSNPSCYRILTLGHGFLWLPKVNSSNI